MRRKTGTEYLLLQAVTDLVAISGGLLLAYSFRFHSGVVPLSGAWEPALYSRLWVFATVIWLFSLYVAGCYSNHPRVISFNRARRLMTGSALAVALVVVFNYFLVIENVSRLLFPFALLATAASLVIGRGILQKIIRMFFVGRWLPPARMVIVGLGPTALRLAARLKNHPEYAYEVVGFLSAEDRCTRSRVGGVPVLGRIEDVRSILSHHRVQDVFVAQSGLDSEQLFQLYLECEQETARVHVIPSLADMMRTTIYYDEIAGVPIYKLHDSPLGGWNLLVKRGVDVGLSLAGLVVLLPLFPLVAWMIRRSSPGPAIYSQRRLGLDGQEFEIYKLRTMPLDAEAKGPVWAGNDDHRATSFGRFLRRWNLDELPQLWNVLRGDMSIVGPRPERPQFADEFRNAYPRYMARHHVRTGLTGWAQVHGLRGDTSIPQRLRFDLYYIEHWSLWLDIKIMMMTFTRVRRRRPNLGRSHVFTATSPLERSRSCPNTQTSPDELPGSPGRAAESATP